MGKISIGKNIIYDDTQGGGGETIFLNLQRFFASSVFGTSYELEKAFDGIVNTAWAASGNIGQFLGVDFALPIIVTRLYILDVGNRLKEFVFEGSNEKTANYTALLIATRPSTTLEVAFDISNTVAYRYYRVRCTSALYNGTNMLMSELRMEYKTVI